MTTHRPLDQIQKDLQNLQLQRAQIDSKITNLREELQALADAAAAAAEQ